jgi:hypothetical protein
LPAYRAPRDYTYGVRCTSDTDCAPTVLECVYLCVYNCVCIIYIYIYIYTYHIHIYIHSRAPSESTAHAAPISHTCPLINTYTYIHTQSCTFGVNCSCCANLTHVCSSDDDCSRYEQGSPCGCVAGGPANGICGPFCPEEKPEKPELDCIITNFINFNASRRLWGPRCTYRSPKIVGTSTQPLIESCVGPGYITSGSGFSRVLQLVSSTSAGSRFISFFGGIQDVNQGLKNLEYVTDKGYNRLYRYAFCCACT